MNYISFERRVGIKNKNININIPDEVVKFFEIGVGNKVNITPTFDKNGSKIIVISKIDENKEDDIYGEIKSNQSAD